MSKCGDELDCANAPILFAEVEKQLTVEWAITDNVDFLVSDTTAVTGVHHALLENHTGAQLLYCSPHTLQLTADIVFDSRFFGDPPSTVSGCDGDVLTLARSIVCYFQDSPQSMNELKKCQVESEVDVCKDVNFPTQATIPTLDDVTCSLSTMSIVESLLELKEALKLMAKKGELEKSMILTDEQWSILASIKVLLEPFKQAQTMFEGQDDVTASLVYPFTRAIYDSLLDIVSNDDLPVCPQHCPKVKECAEAMLADLAARYCNDFTNPFHPTHVYAESDGQVGFDPALLKASRLDPRLKDLPVIHADNLAAIDQCLVEEMEKLVLPKPSQEWGVAKSPGNSKAPPHEIDEILLEKGANSEKKTRAGDEVACDGLVSCKEELQRYVDYQVAIPKGASALGIWKDIHAQYPRVWMLAKKYLAIPASPAPSDLAVSSAGNVVKSKPTRLGHGTVTETLFLRENSEYVKKLCPKVLE